MNLLIVETLIKISLVLAAATTVNVLLFRRRSAASRHLVWTLGVLGLLLLPILSTVLPKWELPIRMTGVLASVDRPPTPAFSEAGRLRTVESRADRQGRLDTTGEEARTADLEAAGLAGVPWETLLAGVHVAGALFLLFRMFAQRWAMKRLVRRASVVTDPAWTALLIESARRIGVQRQVRLLRSRDHTMPMAVGTRRPAILVPAVADEWSHERRQAVLLHELAHVARRDCLTQLIAAVACAVYWIHPGVWWVARRLRAERELACDDRVLGVGTEARDYAGHLLELAYALGGRREPAHAVAMARRRQLEGRMLAVLDAARNRTRPTLGGRLSGAAMTVLVLVPLAAVEATRAPIAPIEAAAAEAPAVAEPAQTDSARDAVALQGQPGTWEIQPSSTAGVVDLRLTESRNSSYSFRIPVAGLEGLSPSQLAGSGGRVEFRIRRDAGSFAFEGTVRSGVGAGTYTFSPSASFPGALTARGFARPTPADQYRLARGDIGLAFLDELRTQGYSNPTLPQLVRSADHGVDFNYLREMGRLGYRVGQLETLIKMVDHGVSPQYVRELRAQGLPSLSADDLVRARDHGVVPEYVGELRTLGYGPLSLELLVHARDHGISPDYVRGMRELGYRFTLEELTKARDHGVGVDYIRELTALGHARLSLEALIGARDHGISPDYVRALWDIGYRLTLEELVKARDHGVEPKYVRDLTALGYQQLSLEDLIRLRDHGVTPEYVRQLKSGGRGTLTVDDLVRLRDAGVGTNSRLRSMNDLLRDAGERLHQTSVRDMIRAFANSLTN